MGFLAWAASLNGVLRLLFYAKSAYSYSPGLGRGTRLYPGNPHPSEFNLEEVVSSSAQAHNPIQRLWRRQILLEMTQGSLVPRQPWAIG